MSDEQVTFWSDGHRIAGTLVRPASAERPTPGVVISHGWSGAVNERVFPLARRLAAAGHAVLCIDHRGFGGSDGERARCDPAGQVRDLSNALTFLGSEPLVDASALGVIGVSFGGAIAIAAGAADPRARATVSIVGIGDAGRWLRSLRPSGIWAHLEHRMAEDQVAIVRTGARARVDFSELMPLPPSQAVDDELAIMRAKYPEGYPLENLHLAAGFRPEEVVDRIAPRAVLLLTCADDSVVPASDSAGMYDRAGEPKELEVFPEGNHGGPLGPLVDRTAAVVGDFLDRHLRALS